MVGIGIVGKVEVFQEIQSPSGQSLDRKWRPGEEGQALRLQDQVKTDINGRARIKFADSHEGPPPSGPSVFNVGSNTIIAISQFGINFDKPIPAARGIIDLIRGTIRNFIRGTTGQNSDFSVRAGVSVCSLRDAEAQVEYDPKSGRLLVHVHKGKVSINSSYGARLVKQGESAMFIDGKFSSGGPQ